MQLLIRSLIKRAVFELSVLNSFLELLWIEIIFNLLVVNKSEISFSFVSNKLTGLVFITEVLQSFLRWLFYFFFILIGLLFCGFCSYCPICCFVNIGGAIFGEFREFFPPRKAELTLEFENDFKCRECKTNSTVR